METPLWKVAFAQCRAQIVAGSDLPIHEEHFEQFMRGRDAKFERRLNNGYGAQRWRQEGPTIRKWSALIGTLAELEARYAPDPNHPETVTQDHLQIAFAYVNTRCQVRRERDEKDGIRAEYC